MSPEQLPSPDMFSAQNEEQYERAEELTELLEKANDVLLPAWAQRVEIADKFLYGQTDGLFHHGPDGSIHQEDHSYGIAIAEIIAREAGIDRQQLRSTIKAFVKTGLGEYIDQVTSPLAPSLFVEWHNKLSQDEPSTMIATQLYPQFSKQTFMLGCEKNVVDLLSVVTRCVESQKLPYYVSEDYSAEIDGLNGSISLYKRLALANEKPIDLERLVGVSKTVMTKLGLLAR